VGVTVTRCIKWYVENWLKIEYWKFDKIGERFWVHFWEFCFDKNRGTILQIRFV